MSVQTNTRIDIDGNVWHIIVTNCMGASNYYLKEEVTNMEIEYKIALHEQKACNYVDNREQKVPPPIDRLNKLGFS